MTIFFYISILNLFCYEDKFLFRGNLSLKTSTENLTLRFFVNTRKDDVLQLTQAGTMQSQNPK